MPPQDSIGSGRPGLAPRGPGSPHFGLVEISFNMQFIPLDVPSLVITLCNYQEAPRQGTIHAKSSLHDEQSRTAKRRSGFQVGRVVQPPTALARPLTRTATEGGPHRRS